MKAMELITKFVPRLNQRIEAWYLDGEELKCKNINICDMDLQLYHFLQNEVAFFGIDIEGTLVVHLV